MPTSNRLHKFFPFLSWPRPTGALLRSEAMAGLTVGLMVIPQGVAYAALAGMPLITGIYASMLPALIAVLFSASTRLGVGPTALSCLLIGASLTGLATPGSAEWINLAVWLAILSGLLQVGLGVLRFGWLLNLVNSPVLMAFTQAAAILIVLSQVPAFLGLEGSWAHVLQQPHWLWQAPLFGAVSLAILMLARRWRPAFPTVLVVVLIASGVSYLMGFEANGGKVVGVMPNDLPQFYLPRMLDLATFKTLFVPTLIITLVSFLETASSAKVDSENRGERWNQNQDLIGQGLAKIASGFSGAFPTSSSFSRSALNLYAGAKTGWASIFAVIVVFIALLLFMPVLHHVPQAVLASIVLVAVIGLLKPQAFVRLWRISKVEAGIAGTTFLITLVASPQLYWGVLAGVVMSLAYFMYQRLNPRIIEVGLHTDGTLRDRKAWQLPALADQTYAFRIDAGLDFATTPAFEAKVANYLAENPDTTQVCLFAQSVDRLDATGVDALIKLAMQLDRNNISFSICGLKTPVENTLKCANLKTYAPNVKFYRTEQQMLQGLSQHQQPE
jgi:SulP family sulfate permease